MLLGLKSDGPIAELYLYDGDVLVSETKWEADRELAHGLLKKIDQFLAENDATFEQISGLFAFKGPGSFTGLRIGLTVMNTLAYATALPIVAETGDMWRENAAKRLQNGQNDQIVLPLYGAEARITQPKK